MTHTVAFIIKPMHFLFQNCIRTKNFNQFSLLTGSPRLQMAMCIILSMRSSQTMQRMPAYQDKMLVVPELCRSERILATRSESLGQHLGKTISHFLRTCRPPQTLSD